MKHVKWTMLVCPFAVIYFLHWHGAVHRHHARHFWMHPLQALIEKMRGRLAPEAFARFKQQTAEFLHGQLTPAELHASAVRLELAALAPELAALCPDAERRAGLLQAHSDTFAEGCSTEVRRGQHVLRNPTACHQLAVRMWQLVSNLLQHRAPCWLLVTHALKKSKF